MDSMTYSTKYINFEKIHFFFGDAENLIFFFGDAENFKMFDAEKFTKTKKTW